MFAPDCFHLNRKGHYGMALMLWNTMVIIFTKVKCRALACISQFTRDIRPKLAQCWPSVAYDGPRLSRHWVNCLVLAGSPVNKFAQRCLTILVQFWI